MSKPMSVRNKVFPKYEPKDQGQHVMMVCPSRILFLFLAGQYLYEDYLYSFCVVVQFPGTLLSAILQIWLVKDVSLKSTRLSRQALLDPPLRSLGAHKF